jgi:hypothetical protein
MPAQITGCPVLPVFAPANTQNLVAANAAVSGQGAALS